MTMNSHHPPTQTPECQSFAAIITVLDEPNLDARSVAAARAHLVTCAYCQRRQREHVALDAAVRREFGKQASIFLSAEAIMSQLLDPMPTSQRTIEKDSPKRRLARSQTNIIAASLAAILIAGLAFYALVLHPFAVSHRSQSVKRLSWLSGVSMVSTGEGWAVGNTIALTPNPTPLQPLLYHYHNGTWSVQQPSTQLKSAAPIFTAVSMLAANDGWAVGGILAKNLSFIAHYDGTTWTPVVTNIDAYLSKIEMISPSDGWAVGFGTNPTARVQGTPVAEQIDKLPTTLLHYDGKAWTQQAIPQVGPKQWLYLDNLSMLPGDEGWFAGVLSQQDSSANVFDGYQNVIYHYKQGKWELSYTAPSTTGIGAISMLSPTEGWADASRQINPPKGQIESFSHAFMLHYHDGTWTESDLPGQPSNVDRVINSMAVSSATNGWAMGFDYSSTLTPSTLLIFHWDGQHWTQIQSPVIRGNHTISQISMISDSEGWAVGETRILPPPNTTHTASKTTYTANPLILHFYDGVWHVEVGP
jgi:hypothetical protein